jgi:uridine phosphorylase
MNCSLLLPGIGCTAVAILALSACGSTSAPSTTTTTRQVASSAAPCTAAALQAALPAGTTVVTTDLGFKCQDGYAGAEITIASTGTGGPPGGITTDTLFRAENSTWVAIGRSQTNCAEVPPSIHVYCTVS